MHVGKINLPTFWLFPLNAVEILEIFRAQYTHEVFRSCLVIIRLEYLREFSTKVLEIYL